MGIYNRQSLLKLFEESRKREKEKKQLEKQRYKQASESIKKQRVDKLPIIIDKCFSQPLKEEIEGEERVLIIYHSKYIEKFNGKLDDLYSKEDLIDIEKRYPNECGRINWGIWNQLVEQTQKWINKT